jgi:hypothetical protein
MNESSCAATLRHGHDGLIARIPIIASKGRHGGLGRGPECRIDAEGDAHDGRKDERDRCGPGGYENAQIEQRVGDPSPCETQQNTHHPARERKDGRLGKELGEDFGWRRPERHSQPDLSGPFSYGHQHDVHDPDSTDEKRD